MLAENRKKMLLSNFPATGWLFLPFLHTQVLLRKIYRKLLEALFRQVTPPSVHNNHCHTQGILGKDLESTATFATNNTLFPGLMLQNATNIHISAIKSIQSILVVTLFNSEVVGSKQSNQICRGGETPAVTLLMKKQQVGIPDTFEWPIESVSEGENYC